MNVAPNGDTEVEVEYYNVEDAAEAFKARIDKSIFNKLTITFK